MTELPDGRFRVIDTDLSDGDEGTDILEGIEVLRFADGDVIPEPGGNAAPVANDDTASGDEDGAIAGNVLTNDSDADGDTLTVAPGTGPAHGDLTLNPDGSFSYVPAANYVHVPYRGGAPAMTDLMTGQIDFMFTPAPNSIAQLKSGRVRGIAVTSLKRSGVLPDLPTMNESGLKGFELLAWIGLMGPAGTPPAVISRLNGEVQKMFGGDLKSRLFDLGLDVAGGSPEQFGEFIKKDIAKYAKIVQAAKIPPQ